MKKGQAHLRRRYTDRSNIEEETNNRQSMQFRKNRICVLGRSEQKDSP